VENPRGGIMKTKQKRKRERERELRISVKTNGERLKTVEIK
jgi:hypothetical protein